MDLGKHVVDKEIIDRNGLRAGRVDDLLLEGGERLPDGSLAPPEVRSIISGPMALSPILSPPTRWLARHLYILLGLKDPQPVQVPWSAVTAINVAVHVDIGRGEYGMSELMKAAARRYICRLPGS